MKQLHDMTSYGNQTTRIVTGRTITANIQSGGEKQYLSPQNCENYAMFYRAEQPQREFPVSKSIIC